MDPFDPQASELPSSEDNASFLCAECQKLNLIDVFTQNPVPSIAFAQCLGRRELRQEPFCKLCRAFWTIRSDHGHSEFEIWVGSLMAISSEIVNTKRERVVSDDLNQVCIAVVPAGYDQEKHIVHMDRIPYLTRYLNEEKIDHSRYQILAVEPQPNYAMIRGWISECRDNHIDCNAHGDPRGEDSALEGVRMINVQTQTIEPYHTGQDYVTLSYVWGSGRGGHVNSWRSALGAQLPADLPDTIKDAIEVVRILGFQHLWVDQYCIDQHDDEHVASQIRVMGQIYSESQLTVVAAAGDDCQYGLPGVGKRGRMCQIYRDYINGVGLIASPARPERLIQSSKYATRGWTFQEGFLARRRLVFTDEQVYFECRRTYSFESLQRPMAAIYDEPQSGHPTIKRGIRRGYFESACAATPTWIPIHIGNKKAEWNGHFRSYLKRELKYQSDLLNAFRGVQDQYFPSFQGMPLFNLSAQINTREQTHKELARALGWVSTKWSISARRLEFPSFTWAGWTGIPLVEQVPIVDQVIRFLGMDDWQPGDKELDCLEVETSIVVLDVQLNDQDDQLSLVPATTLHASDSKNYIDTIHIPHIPQIGGGGNSRVHEVECILLFRSETGYCFLAIKRVEDWVERIGLLELDKEHLPDWSFKTERFKLK